MLVAGPLPPPLEGCAGKEQNLIGGSLSDHVHGRVGCVRDGHGGGGSRKINAWHIYTLMVYL